METLKKILNKHRLDMKKINEQRQWWLIISSVVFISVILFIFSWDIMNDWYRSYWWVLVSTILIITVNWWYWTMKSITVLLSHQQEENQIIKELITEVREIKKTIEQFDKN